MVIVAVLVLVLVLMLVLMLVLVLVLVLMAVAMVVVVAVAVAVVVVVPVIVPMPMIMVVPMIVVMIMATCRVMLVRVLVIVVRIRLVFVLLRFGVSVSVLMLMLMSVVMVMVMVMAGTRSLCRCGLIRSSGSFEIGKLLVQYVVGELQGNFVQYGERAHRHADLDPDILNRCRRDTFTEQSHAFVHERAEDPACIKSARIVDDNRRLADLQDEVVGLREGDIGSFSSADDFDQLHAVNWREEVKADEFIRPGRRLGEPRDRQGRGVGGKNGIA